MGEEDIIHACQKGVLPKLPFLLEEKDEANLKDFFTVPKTSENSSETEKGTKIPITVEERVVILQAVERKICDLSSPGWWVKLPAKSRVPIILFLSESVDGTQLWSNSSCSSIVGNICLAISNSIEPVDTSTHNNPDLSAWFRKNFDECLTPNETDFHHILQSVKTKLTKSEWKYYPACIHGFGWILQQVCSPSLSHFVDLVIPPALLLSDDHYDDYKLVGLKSLAHVVENSDKTDLTSNNIANVIFDAVQRHLSDRDPVVISLMMSILMKILSIIEKDPSVNSDEFTQYDQILKSILFQMEFCSDLPQKKIWLPILNNYVNTLGLASLHWSNKICDVLRDYTTCSDAIIWSQILDVVQTIIRNTWVKVNCDSLCEILLRIIFNVSSFHSVCLKDNEKSEILSKVSLSLKLLRKCDGHDKVDAQFAEILSIEKSENLHPKFIESVKQILET